MASSRGILNIQSLNELNELTSEKVVSASVICLLAGRGNSQGRLGRGEGIHGELGSTRARRARSRHQPGDTVRSAHPKGEGTGTTGVADMRA
jgi:hypothetical protein